MEPKIFKGLPFKINGIFKLSAAGKSEIKKDLPAERAGKCPAFSAGCCIGRMR
jgi:hypothetical protein